MIDCIALDDDLDKTQRLPVLTAKDQLDEALQREREARIEIIELLRQNAQQAMEIERLKGLRSRAFHPSYAHTIQSIERIYTSEETLFEVCAALQRTLATLLSDCQAEGLSPDSGEAAARTLEESCDKLELALSAPGFRAVDAQVCGDAGVSRLHPRVAAG